ncbi:MAG: helix-turn-helix domain-containing protein [Acidimicrobiia bacterium]
MRRDESRRQLLESTGLVHPHPESVSAALFAGDNPFFLSLDKVQVKYEMLRAHVVEGSTVTAAAAAHGYSRAEFYLVAAGFEAAGMTGLLDGRRGRKGPTKLTPEVKAFIGELGECSAVQAAIELEASLGVRLHPRSIQRVRRG